MSTSISINSKNDTSGVKKQKSVSYIDPQASNADLITFAQGMVSLMADTSYESTTRIERTECDDASAPIRTGNCTIGGVTQAYDTQNPSLSFTVPTSTITNNEFIIQLDNFGTFTDAPHFKNNVLPIVYLTWKSGSAAGTGRRLLSLTVKLNSSEAQTVTGTLIIPPNGTTREQNLNLTITFE